MLEAGFLEVRHVVGRGERDPEPRHRAPSRLGLARLRRERIPTAVLLAELVDDIAHVAELALEQERNRVVRADHVVARLRLRLGGELRHQLQVRDGVHAHAYARCLAERFGLLAQLVVGRRDEVIPGEQCQLALLAERRRAVQRQPCRKSRRGRSRGLQELAAGCAGHGGTLLCGKEVANCGGLSSIRLPSSQTARVYTPPGVVGGGFLRTGCGPGPLEPDPGNAGEGNMTRTDAAAPSMGERPFSFP